MVHVDFDYLTQRFLDLRAGIQTLPRRLAELLGGRVQRLKEFERFYRQAAGLTLIFGGFTLAWVAHHVSSAEAVASWKRQLLPSRNVLTGTLSSYGFRSVTDVTWIHAVAKTLPLNIDAFHSVWISQDGLWIAFPADEMPVVYSRSPGKPFRLQWRMLGHGWDGYSALVDGLSRESQRTAPGPAKAVPHKPQESRDPRALEY